MIVFVIILLGIVLKTSYRNPDFKSKNYLFLFLTIVAIHAFAVFINYKFLKGVDTRVFYSRAITSTDWFGLFKIGSRSMSFMIYPFTKFGFSYFDIALLFSVISLKGYFIYLNLLLTKIKPLGIYHFLLVAFFCYPSLHIWTTSLYKESLLFTLMAIILKQLWSIKPFNYKLLISILIITLIRPYISLILILSIIIIYYKIIIKEYKVASLLLLSLITIIAVKFLNILNLSSFKDNFDKIITYSINNGNSSIDLLNSNYLERFFLVLFRPLFFDSKTLFQFFVSIENFGFAIVLMIFTYKIYYLKPKFRLIDKHIRFTLLFSITCILFYSIYMYNLGLASRMRVMFIPFLLIGMFNMLSLKKM